MYGMLFGQNGLAPALLGALGLTRDDFGRFRDAGVAGGEIYVYTRCGGGNRADYGEVFEAMGKHANYLRDEDDDFDCTYCAFYFSFPENFRAELEKIDSSEKFDPSKRWLDMIASIEDGTNKDAVEKLTPVVEQVLEKAKEDSSE
tara:strand:+ start:509 stop:943 length:435 start_codon:yes stop_codon:yes gene_type:complete